MKRRSFSPDQGLGIPLTPLIDMVFLLLIYFMLASNFVEEQQFHVELPESSHGHEVSRHKAAVTVTKDGRFFLNSRQMDADELQGELKRMKAAEELRSLEIRIDRLAPAGLAVKVLDAAGAAGISEVSISTAAVQVKNPYEKRKQP